MAYSKFRIAAESVADGRAARAYRIVANLDTPSKMIVMVPLLVETGPRYSFLRYLATFYQLEARQSLSGSIGTRLVAFLGQSKYFHSEFFSFVLKMSIFVGHSWRPRLANIYSSHLRPDSSKNCSIKGQRSICASLRIDPTVCCFEVVSEELF